MSGRLAPRYRPILLSVAAILLAPSLALAQSPWERAASNLALTFTGPLARSLALVSIVIGGLLFMFGEAGAKRQISGIVFGGGLALFAAQFLTWLFCSGYPRNVGSFGHVRPPDVSTRLEGDPPSAHGLRRRSSPVLPRADPRRRHVQPLLLVPGRPADVRGPVRIRAVGDAS